MARMIGFKAEPVLWEALDALAAREPGRKNSVSSLLRRLAWDHVEKNLASLPAEISKRLSAAGGRGRVRSRPVWRGH